MISSAFHTRCCRWTLAHRADAAGRAISASCSIASELSNAFEFARLLAERLDERLNLWRLDEERVNASRLEYCRCGRLGRLAGRVEDISGSDLDRWRGNGDILLREPVPDRRNLRVRAGEERWSSSSLGSVNLALLQQAGLSWKLGERAPASESADTEERLLPRSLNRLSLISLFDCDDSERPRPPGRLSVLLLLSDMVSTERHPSCLSSKAWIAVSITEPFVPVRPLREGLREPLGGIDIIEETLETFDERR